MGHGAREHPIYRISSIGRPVDLRLLGNTAIVIVAAVALVGGAVWGWVQAGSLGAALAAGGSAALVAFLSWALGRELDPDVNATAFVGVGLALAIWVVVDGGDLWPLAAALIGSRIVNRTVGPPARITDAIVVVGLVGIGVLFSGRWSLALIGAVAFVLDAILKDGVRRSWIFAAASLGWLPLAWQRGHLQIEAMTRPWVVGTIAFAFVVAIATLPPPRSPCDLPGHALDRRRLQGGMLVALFAALLAQLDTTGLAAPSLLAVLTATVLGRAWPHGGSSRPRGHA